jgi:hypothetical protein
MHIDFTRGAATLTRCYSRGLPPMAGARNGHSGYGEEAPSCLLGTPGPGCVAGANAAVAMQGAPAHIGNDFSAALCR